MQSNHPVVLWTWPGSLQIWQQACTGSWRFAWKQKVVYASHRHRDLKAQHSHESSLHAFGRAWHWFCRKQRGVMEACVDVRSECSWAPKVALQDVCLVKSRGPVYCLRSVCASTPLLCSSERMQKALLILPCNGCSPIKVKENFTPPSSFQRFQIVRILCFLQLTLMNCIFRYTVDYRCISGCSITPDN